MEHNKLIDEMVRDFTTVVPRSKSEVRRRIEALLSQQREEMKRKILLLRRDIDVSTARQARTLQTMLNKEFNSALYEVLSALTPQEVEHG